MPDSIAHNRWRIPIALAVTVFVNYLDRNNLALAIPKIAADFGWSDREIGANGEILLAAFFLSYAFSNLLLSPIAERWGAKRSLKWAIVAFSLITILSAILGRSIILLIGLRLLLGVAEGIHIPMLSAITSRWFPLSQRSRANAIWSSGILVATALAPLMIVPLIAAWGWRPTFAILGIVGMLVSLPLLQRWVQEYPAVIDQQLDGIDRSSLSIAASPHLSYRRDRRFWLAVAGGILNAFCAFGLLNWLPTYFNRAKNIDFAQLGWPLALVFTAGIVGIGIMAYLGDKLQHRIWLACIGFCLAGIFVYLAAQSDQITTVICLFAIAVFCQSAYNAQEYAIVQRLLPPDRVGSGTGFYNGLTILFGGIGGSLIPGSIVAATGSFDAGMLSLVVGAILAAIVLAILALQLRY